MHPAAEVALGRLEVRAGRALGSPLRLLAAPPGSADAAWNARVDAAWVAIVETFAAVDAAMSRFREDSEVTRLNRAGGRAVEVSRLLRVALVNADRARRVTGGRFDPRVLRDMDRLGFAGVRVDGDAWRGVAARPGPERDRVAACTAAGVRLSAPVDLGGIGKGLALRWAADAAEPHLADGGLLLDAGGDVATRGRGPLASTVEGSHAGRWSIGIEDPRGDETPVATCALPGGHAIATSSTRIARRTSTAGEVHHLIDPRTGRPGGEGVLAVTVAHRDPAWAEVWSKALFLAGAAGIGPEARSRCLAAWWVASDGSVSMTPAARAVTTWVRQEAADGVGTGGGPVSPP